MWLNRIMNIFPIIVFIVILIILLIEFNTEYTVINNNNTSISKTLNYKNIGTLFIVTHNYEHKDIFITFNYFAKLN